MTADSFISYLTQLMYLVVFVATAGEAIRRPRSASVDIALLFGACALLIAPSWAFAAFNIQPTDFMNSLTSAFLMTLPYLLVRLVDDFAGVPPWITRASAVGLGLAILGLFAFPKLPGVLPLLYVLYFIGLELYAAVVLIRQSARSRGVTQRRMQAAAFGSLCLGLFIFFTALQWLIPSLNDFWTIVIRMSGLFSGLGYLFGFAPPGWLRRLWQFPDLLGFLRTASSLPRMGDTDVILRELERGAAVSLGAAGAAISLWDDAAQRLLGQSIKFEVDEEKKSDELASNQLISGQVFASQKPMFFEDVAKVDAKRADVYRANNATTILGAPITIGDKRLGVLLAYGPRPALFAEDDVAMIQLLADQAAVVLQSRALIGEVARVQAREETARLKEDFLSVAAHDLRTPLTALLGQTQLLRRRSLTNPSAPVDPQGLQRIEDETRRLIRFVNELLDVSRTEQGLILGEREWGDLVGLALDVAERRRSRLHEIIVDNEGPVVGFYDWGRMDQVLENLVENAIKYSPEGGDIRIKVWKQDDEARIDVRDQGIGIPAKDLPHTFDRFYRGANVNDRQFAGLGLGLFMCRRIIEAHGGRIDVESVLGRGTTVHVSLPWEDKVGSGE